MRAPALQEEKYFTLYNVSVYKKSVWAVHIQLHFDFFLMPAKSENIAKGAVSQRRHTEKNATAKKKLGSF